MKTFREFTKKEKSSALKKFMELHKPLTEPCEFVYEIQDDGTVEFTPKEGNTLHGIDIIAKFAEYHNANIYCSVWQGKIYANVF